MTRINTQSSTPIPSSIVDQFCNQMIAMQRSIEARGPELCFPSPQELNMQAKIMTNVIRIKKYNATDFVANAFKQFIKFASKGDKQLGKAIAEAYSRFMGADLEEEDLSPAAEKAVVHTTPMPVAEQPPVTVADFHQHRHELKHYHQGSQNSTAMFNGRHVNKYWLEHNLVQHMLPEAERKFIKEADFAYNYLQRCDIIRKIEAYLPAM